MDKNWDELEYRLKQADVLLKEKELEDTAKPPWRKPTIIISFLTLALGFWGGMKTSSIEESELNKRVEGLKTQKTILMEHVETTKLNIEELEKKLQELTTRNESLRISLETAGTSLKKALRN